MFEKIYILIFLILFFLFVFVIPSLRVRLKTGINPYVFKRTDNASDFLGKISTPITSLVFLVAIINLFFPEWLIYFAPFFWLINDEIKIAGLIIAHAALIWIIIAQIQMSSSWRVGIDYDSKTELKTTGLFSVSRNPVFLGIIVTLFGFFVVIPNAITLLVAVTSSILMQIQVRLEETFLVNVHGIAYSDYYKNVRRWI